MKSMTYFNPSIYNYRVGIHFIDYIITKVGIHFIDYINTKLYLNKVLFGLKTKKI